MTDLFLRPTVIAGDTLKADFVVIHEDRVVGRIRLADERAARGRIFDWMITIPLPIQPWCRGSVGNLEEAKAAFKDAWNRFLPTLTAHDIEHWHHHQDAANKKAADPG